MAAKFGDLMIEKRSIDYVPIAERHGKVWHLWPVWFSGDAHLATVATGVVGVALGALLVWGVALIAYIGFDAFNQILAAQTVRSLYGGDSTVTILVFTILSVSLAVIGYDLIHLAQRWIAYLLIAALLIFTVAVLTRAHLPAQEIALRDFRVVPFLAQFFAAASYQIAWSIYVSDAVLPGFGKPLLLCSLFGLVTITSLNYYGASLTLLSVMDSITPSRPTLAKRLLTLLVSTVIATSLALASSQNFVAKFGEFLAVLLYLFTPWTAINLVDFYLIRKGHYSVREIFNSRGMYGRWCWRGLWAYGIGFVAMIPFFSTESWKGPVAKALGGADVAMLIGLPVSALVYIAACRSLDVVADRRDRKSTRLNSSHPSISYAVFCLKKKNITQSHGYTTNQKKRNDRSMR